MRGCTIDEALHVLSLALRRIIQTASISDLVSKVLDNQFMVGLCQNCLTREDFSCPSGVPREPFSTSVPFEPGLGFIFQLDGTVSTKRDHFLDSVSPFRSGLGHLGRAGGGSSCFLNQISLAERKMTVFRASNEKNGHSTDIPAPIPWRHSRTPSVSSIPNLSPATTATPKYKSIVIQLLLIVILIGYICLPSRTVRHFSSKASIAEVSNAGRKVVSTLAEVANILSGKSDSTAGVAIVAACMNRQGTLAKVLPTWLSVEGVHEVVIVDWCSDPPLKSIVQPEKDPRLNLYRVNSEKSWVLSRAYNLALNKTKSNYVIRTDCDYALDNNLLDAHSLNETETGFYSGNWMLARDENEIHLNGAMVLKREDFWNVGGYDERIQTYGWDDEDLYTRLSSSNVKKLNVSYDHVSHVSHRDGKRAQEGVKFVQVQIDLNQLLLEKLPQWSRSDIEGPDSSRYKVVIDDGVGYVELEAVYVPKSLSERVDEDVYEESWAMALGRRLADDFHVPWEILETMDSGNKELMLRKLMALRIDLDFQLQEQAVEGPKSEGDVKFPTEARMLFVHCMHGLGNRLRALGSALAFAKHSKRVPVVIWESDAHIAAEFDALFNCSDLVVLTKFIPQWPLTGLHKYDPAWNHFRFYNYMETEEGAVKGELIVNEEENHLYYKGAYILEAPDYTWWEAGNEELRKLQPVKMVEDHLKLLEEQGLSSAIGVHIRNRTLAADIKNVDFNKEYGSEAAVTMEHWRSQSSYSNFVAEMKRILEEGDGEIHFYIATDTWTLIPLMEELFPGRILSTKRTCDERDSACVKYAVIDMYALSRTRELLGSNWSSYTEMAERLGGLKAKLAGQDFGSSPEGPEGAKTLEAEQVEKSEEELAAEQQDRWLDTSRE